MRMNNLTENASSCVSVLRTPRYLQKCLQWGERVKRFKFLPENLIKSEKDGQVGEVGGSLRAVGWRMQWASSEHHMARGRDPQIRGLIG